MRHLFEISLLRRLVIPALQKFNLGDIAIRHHWTDDKLTLHSFRHKGYWYHGKKREMATMLLFSELIRKGDSVVEIGAHIGYVSLYFGHLVGAQGHVVVFEPGPNNLPYIRRNTRSRSCIVLVEKAVTDYVGSATLYVENLTGQNNSLVARYPALEVNKQAAHVSSIDESCIDVPCTSLDDFLRAGQLPAPSFVKIDVEGAELSVLRGMKQTLGERDIALMVEVTQNAPGVFALLQHAGFQLFRTDKSAIDDSTGMKGNVFCLRGTDDRISRFRA